MYSSISHPSQLHFDTREWTVGMSVHQFCVFILVNLYAMYVYRTLIAAMHFNENSNRKQAVTRKGEHRFSIVFPKYKKGGYVVKRVVQAPTYGKTIKQKGKIFMCIVLS